MRACSDRVARAHVTEDDAARAPGVARETPHDAQAHHGGGFDVLARELAVRHLEHVAELRFAALARERDAAALYLAAAVAVEVTKAGADRRRVQDRVAEHAEAAEIPRGTEMQAEAVVADGLRGRLREPQHALELEQPVGVGEIRLAQAGRGEGLRPLSGAEPLEGARARRLHESSSPWLRPPMLLAPIVNPLAQKGNRGARACARIAAVPFWRRAPMARALLVCLFASLFAAPAFAQEDVAPGAPTFKEGDVISLDKVEALKPFLPEEFWANRDFFFYEGMQLEIGPSFKDYSPFAGYVEATKKYAGQAKIGPESSLENFTMGQPFPMDQIDCKGDPQAGAKIAWNFITAGRGCAAGRASTTRTGTAARSCRSTTRAPATATASPSGPSRSSPRARATCSATRSATRPRVPRWTRPSTRAASC